MNPYKKIKIDDTLTLFHDDIGAIPDDRGNRHYQEYLTWLEEGNEPTIYNPESEPPLE